jgi:hypothetical protein
MGKTSKFSFPLPGRRGQPHFKESPAVADMPKLSKAERLLGASNLPVNNTPQTQLRKQPSSLTLNLYESSIDGFDDVSENEYPVPEMPAQYRDSPKLPEPVSTESQPQGGTYNAFPRSQSVSGKGSTRVQLERKVHPRSMSSNTIPSIRHLKSTSALHSAFKQIQSIPERPSAAPVREMASRTDTRYHAAEHIPEQTTLMAAEGAANFHERRRPSRLDLTNIFPKTPSNANTTTGNHISSPTSIFSSGPYLPEVPILPLELTSPKSATGSTQRKLSKSKRSGSVEQLRRPQTASAATTRRQGGSGSRKTKHWFDGLLEAEDQFLVPFEPEVPVPPIPKRIHPPTKSRTVSREEISIRLVERSSPIRSSPKGLAPMYETSMKRTSWQGQYAQSLRASVISDPSELQDRTPQETQQSGFEDSSLSDSPTPQVDEFLDAGESDSESDEERDSSSLPGVRDSIAIEELDETVTIGEAQAFQVRPRRILGKVQVTSAQQVTQLATRPQNGKLQSSRPIVLKAVPRKISISHDKALESSSTTVKPAEATPPSRPDSIISISPSSLGHMQDPKHKLMAVTAEEEALLAMMRQKRAAMASHSFAAGYKTALLSSPQSPMFVNVRRNSGCGPSLTARSRSSIGGELAQNIEPPLSPPPASRLPSPPEEETVTEQKSTEKRNRDSLIQSSTSSRQPSVSEQPPIRLSSPVPIDTLYTKLHTLPTSPTMIDGLSMSPSNTSQTSGLPSPVTPQTARSANNVAIVIPDSSSRSDSSGSETDFLDHTSIDSQKTFSSLPTSLHAHVRASSGSTAVSDDEGASIEVHAISQDVTPKGKDTSLHRPNFSRRILATQQYGSYSSYIHNNAHQLQEPVTSFLNTTNAIHVHNGCCGEVTDVRCSVADDVIQAWGDLGGWQDLNRFRPVA